MGGYTPVVYLAFRGINGEWISSSQGSFAVYEWYHFEIVYNSSTHQVNFTVTKDGNIVVSWQGTVSGGFSANLDYLGVSMNGAWVTSNRHEVAYIDNVKMEIFTGN